MNNEIIKDEIAGARSISNIIITLILLIAGSGFFLAGLSSYLHTNLLLVTDTSNITFVPQGVALLFYGTGAIGIAVYLILTIFWNVGSGYNEFSKLDELIRIVRLGFPGRNRTIFLSYEFKNVKNLKLLLKQGLNPRCNILLVLKDRREIPLFPPQTLLNPSETEKKAINLSNFLNVPLESLVI